MADISKINVNETIYNIKDSVARTAISALQSNSGSGGSGGGTMTNVLSLGVDSTGGTPASDIINTFLLIISPSYFNLLYSSSLTSSSHSLEVSTPSISKAKCENQLSGAAPCQCLTFAGIFITSPGFISIGSLPHS